MALTTFSPLTASLTQSLTTNIITTNFTTLPFLTLGNATTDLPFLIPDPSLFSTDPPSFLLDSFNSNHSTFTDYDYTFDDTGAIGANSSSSSDNTQNITTITEEEELNPFLANDYNFYDYNPYDPNSTLVQEPYDYSATAVESEESGVKRKEALKKWDGVNSPPPIKPIRYNALTDLNPWFLWTPPIICLLALSLVVLPCIILKLKDDFKEKQGKERKYGSSRRKSIVRRKVEERMRAEDQERQAAAVSALPPLPGNAYSDIQYVVHETPKANGQKKSQVENSRASPGLVKQNALYIEEKDLNKNKGNGKVVGKHLTLDEPPVDYVVEMEVLAPRSPSKEDGGYQNIEPHRHSSSSGSLTPAEEAAASVETSLGSSTEPERRAVKDEGSEEEEDVEVRDHRSGNFSTAPKTYTKFTGWNRDLYSNGAGFGTPVRKSSSKPEGGSPPGGSTDPDWGIY